jgi:hypothetical protein
MLYIEQTDVISLFILEIICLTKYLAFSFILSQPILKTPKPLTASMVPETYL